MSGASQSWAYVLERLEIVRSSLRFAAQLDRAQVQRLKRQVELLRQDLLLATGRQRFQPPAATVASAGTASPAPSPAPPRSTAARRPALTFEGIFGENHRLAQALHTAAKVAPTDLPVLLLGESGTGKELLAKIIHANSRRAASPLLSVNCGAITPSLLESELFGHLKGAFTGAHQDRKGKFEAAHGGTIFLDEIGELSLESQVKLLRVLQSGEVQRVGSDKVMQVDVRVLAATNRELGRMMAAGSFREDLYYRLSTIGFTIPPLRERRDEIPLLIEYFRSEAAEKLGRPPVMLSPELNGFLLAYHYPGNIRQLRNLVMRLSCLADDQADLGHLPEGMTGENDPPSQPTDQASVPADKGGLVQTRRQAGESAERQMLVQVLAEAKGNVSEAARRLGLNRSYLQVLLKKRGVDTGKFRKRLE